MIPDEILALQAETGWTDDTLLILTFNWLSARKRGGSVNGLVRHLKGLRNAERRCSTACADAYDPGVRVSLTPPTEPV